MESAPNLQVVIMHASLVCSQHLGLPLKMFEMHRTHFDHACLDLLSPVIWSRVLTICHLKLTQRTAPEQKHFNLWSLSPALRNLCNLQTLYFFIPVSSQLQLQAPFLCPEGVWSRQLPLQYYYLLFCQSQFQSMFELFVANSAVISLFQGHVISQSYTPTGP